MKNAVKRVYNTSAPKMTNHAGRTWDHAYVTLPNGEKVKAHFDTTWGEFFYFQMDGKWYRGSVEYQIPNSWNFDIRKTSWKNNGARPASYVGTPVPGKVTYA